MSKKTKTILLVILCAVLVLAAGASFYLMSMLRKVNRTEPTKKSEPDAVETVQATSVPISSVSVTEPDIGDKEEKNILVVGQDRRSGETGNTRSDTMIICTIHPDTHQITMTSLMRDMYVPIPGYNSNRINAAYAYGGMELLDATIEQDFGVKIDGNVEVDFDGFLQTAAMVAPVTMELNADEAEYMTTHPLDGVDTESQVGGWTFTEGENNLYSGAMLEYARMRHVGNSDYERTERQRKLMRAAFSKLKTENAIKQLQFVNNVLPCLTTDLSDADLLKYAKMIIADKYEIANEGYRIPVDGKFTSQSINGMSVLVPDLKANSEALQQYIYGEVVNDQYKYVAKQAEEDASEDEIRQNLIYTEENDSLRASEVIGSRDSEDPEETEEPLSASDVQADTPTPSPTEEPYVPEENGGTENGGTENSGGQEMEVTPTEAPTTPTPTIKVTPTAEPSPAEEPAPTEPAETDTYTDNTVVLIQ